MSPIFSWNGRIAFSWTVCLSALFAGVAPSPTAAQQTHADLSVSAVVTPPAFVSGGRTTVALTVHNAGPDAIDSGTDFSISVFGEDHLITNQNPPYEVLVDEAEGCWAERFLAEWVPPYNDTHLLFAYYFEALPAGESRTCVYEMEYYPVTRPPLTLTWQVSIWYSGTNDDPNPSNDTFSVSLNAAPSASATSVPAGSLVAWLMLCSGVIAGALRRRSTVRG